jgi:hypothetical protein
VFVLSLIKIDIANWDFKDFASDKWEFHDFCTFGHFGKYGGQMGKYGRPMGKYG